jgi:hypothetical protein
MNLVDFDKVVAVGGKLIEESARLRISEERQVDGGGPLLFIIWFGKWFLELVTVSGLDLVLVLLVS